MADPIEDFAKNTLHLSDQDLKVIQAVGLVISLVSTVGAAIATAISVLTVLGVIAKTDEMKQLVDQLWLEFQAVLAGLSEQNTMLAVAPEIGTARTALESLREDAPDDAATPGKSPTWDALRGDVLFNSLQVPTTLAGTAYWVRPTFPELIYQDNWMGSAAPPPPPNAAPNLTFDYRLTLPAYLESIAIRIIILTAMVPDFRRPHHDELKGFATELEGYFNTIRDGIVELPMPEIADFLPGPVVGPRWEFAGSLFGAVERYSTFHVVDNWPISEYPYTVSAAEPLLAPDYPKFRIRHLVRTLARWKEVYNGVGLAALAKTVVQLKALAAVSPVTVTGPTGDWSLRELHQRLQALSVLGLPIVPTNKLSEILALLQTFSPKSYTSLREAVSQ